MYCTKNKEHVAYYFSLAEGSTGAAVHKGMTQLEKNNRQMKEENHLLKLKIELLLDMVSPVSRSPQASLGPHPFIIYIHKWIELVFISGSRFSRQHMLYATM